MDTVKAEMTRAKPKLLFQIHFLHYNFHYLQITYSLTLDDSSTMRSNLYINCALIFN